MTKNTSQDFSFISLRGNNSAPVQWRVLSLNRASDSQAKKEINIFFSYSRDVHEYQLLKWYFTLRVSLSHTSDNQPRCPPPRSGQAAGAPGTWRMPAGCRRKAGGVTQGTRRLSFPLWAPRRLPGNRELPSLPPSFLSSFPKKRGDCTLRGNDKAPGVCCLCWASDTGPGLLRTVTPPIPSAGAQPALLGAGDPGD